MMHVIGNGTLPGSWLYSLSVLVSLWPAANETRRKYVEGSMKPEQPTFSSRSTWHFMAGAMASLRMSSARVP